MSFWKKTKNSTPERLVPELPHRPVEYPSGIAVRTEEGTYYLHPDGKRYRIQSREILESWAFPLLVDTSEVALSKYPVAVTRLGFRNGSLVNNIADGKMYLVSEGKLRHVTGVSALRRLGVTRDDAVVVSESDIKIMKLGEAIT